jgi:hypothetical protein
MFNYQSLLFTSLLMIHGAALFVSLPPCPRLFLDELEELLRLSTTPRAGSKHGPTIVELAEPLIETRVTHQYLLHILYLCHFRAAIQRA